MNRKWGIRIEKYVLQSRLCAIRIGTYFYDFFFNVKSSNFFLIGIRKFFIFYFVESLNNEVVNFLFFICIYYMQNLYIITNSYKKLQDFI